MKDLLTLFGIAFGIIAISLVIVIGGMTLVYFTMELRGCAQ